MVGELWAQVLFTIVFAAVGIHSLLRVADARTWTTRIGMLLHVAMAAAMVAMTWPWGAALPVVPQIVLFAAAAAWFIVRGALTNARLAGSDLVGHSVVAQFFHAAMMTAMCWMLIAMASHGGAEHAAHAAMPAVLAVTGIVAVVLLVAGSAIVGADLVSRPVADGVSARHRVDDVVAVAMALGMAVMSLPMLI